MKRNRVCYLIYLEPWAPGKHITASTKYQMKKILKKANKGSVAYKQRLIFGRDGSISFWNIDQSYPSWEKI